MRSTKLGRKVLVGILCASMVFQSVSVSTYASEREEQTVSESVAYDAEEVSSSSVEEEEEEDTTSSSDEEEDSTSPADEDEIPTEEETENIIMSVSAEEGLDNKGDQLYLHINSNKNSDPEFAKIPWDKCRYIITSVEDSASSGDAEYLNIRTISADEAIVELKKPSSVNDASQLSVEIIYDDIKKVIKPSKETTSDPTEDDFVEVTVHTTVARNNIELKSGILFLSYNPVNCKLNMAVTSDIGKPDVKVITAEESEEYSLEQVGSASSIKDGGEIVKLDRNTKYFVRFEKDGKTYQQEITWGEYKEGVPSEKKPTTIKVYRPYEFEPVLTYTTDTSDITQMVNGVSKYLFSKRFLESKEIRPKDEVYNIEFLDAAGNRITDPLTNVVLAEDKWDRTYKIETKDGEMEKDEPVVLYYGNDDYSSITLTIENAKAEPELIFSNAALMNYVIRKINGSDTSYTATLTVNATGETDVTVKVGDIEETFHVIINRPKKIEKIFFADDSSTRTKDITLEGISKEAAVVVAIDPKMALVGENDITVSSSDDTIVKFKQITDAEAPEGASDNTDDEDSYAYRRITMISTGIGEAEITIKVNGSNEPEKELRCKVTVVNGTFTDAQKQNLQR
ncbi:MAG: hypothetical protein K2M91_08385, partial [Lachnospiraceae bacterium]|nr:hypothetical protein [Lachnospiraceae bacterium]